VEDPDCVVGMLQTEQIAEFTKARGVAPPERIWLVYEAGGETVWSATPDPEGNGEPSVGYALERAGRSYADAGLLAALEGLLYAVCHETGFAAAVRQDSGMAYPWEPLDIAEERARAAIAAVKGA